SVDAYEGSLDLSAFSSKFDAFLAGAATLTADEMAGYRLFDGKGNCNSCHVDGRGTTISTGQTDTSKAATVNPVFTCFGSANEGPGAARAVLRSARSLLVRCDLRTLPAANDRES